MPRKPPAPKPSPTKKSTATAKKSPTRRTGPSADALAGAATQKRERASGQTKQSAMDAVSRRYKVNDSFQTWKNKKGEVSATFGQTKIKDRVTGKETTKNVEWNDTMWEGPQKWSTSKYPDKKTASVMAKRAAAKAATGSKIKKNAR